MLPGDLHQDSLTLVYVMKRYPVLRGRAVPCRLAAYAADPALAAMRLDFTDTIREVLAVMAAGLLARRP